MEVFIHLEGEKYIGFFIDLGLQEKCFSQLYSSKSSSDISLLSILESRSQIIVIVQLGVNQLWVIALEVLMECFEPPVLY